MSWPQGNRWGSGKEARPEVAGDMVALVRAGLTYGQVAQRYGCATTTVQRVVAREGAAVGKGGRGRARPNTQRNLAARRKAVAS